jgi:hypothetical protein
MQEEEGEMYGVSEGMKVEGAREWRMERASLRCVACAMTLSRRGTLQAVIAAGPIIPSIKARPHCTSNPICCVVRFQRRARASVIKSMLAFYNYGSRVHTIMQIPEQSRSKPSAAISSAEPVIPP